MLNKHQIQTIENMQERDLSVLASMETTLFPQEIAMTVDDFRQHYHSRYSFVARNSDGNIVGYILAYSQSSDRVWVESFGVLPNYRQFGLGLKLLEKTVAAAQTTNIGLRVRQENKGAIALYKRVGFIINVSSNATWCYMDRASYPFMVSASVENKLVFISTSTLPLGAQRGLEPKTNSQRYWLAQTDTPSVWTEHAQAYHQLSRGVPSNLALIGGHGTASPLGQPITLNDQYVDEIRERNLQLSTVGLRFKSISLSSCYSATFIPEFQSLLAEDGIIFCQLLSSTASMNETLEWIKREEHPTFNAANFGIMENKKSCVDKIFPEDPIPPFVSDAVYTHRNKTLHIIHHDDLELAIERANALYAGKYDADTEQLLNNILSVLQTEHGIQIKVHADIDSMEVYITNYVDNTDPISEAEKRLKEDIMNHDAIRFALFQEICELKQQSNVAIFIEKLTASYETLLHLRRLSDNLCQINNSPENLRIQQIYINAVANFRISLPREYPGLQWVNHRIEPVPAEVPPKEKPIAVDASHFEQTEQEAKRITRAFNEIALRKHTLNEDYTRKEKAHQLSRPQQIEQLNVIYDYHQQLVVLSRELYSKKNSISYQAKCQRVSASLVAFEAFVTQQYPFLMFQDGKIIQNPAELRQDPIVSPIVADEDNQIEEGPLQAPNAISNACFQLNAMHAILLLGGVSIVIVLLLTCPATAGFLGLTIPISTKVSAMACAAVVATTSLLFLGLFAGCKGKNKPQEPADQHNVIAGNSRV